VTPKQLLRAALALVILVFLWGAVQLFRKSRADRPVGIRMPVTSAAATDSIVIISSSDTLRVVRHPQGWTVNGFPADTSAVNQFFSALADTTATSEMVAESPGSLPRLGVDSTGRRVVIWSGGQSHLDLVFGRHGPDFEGVYVRRPAESVVYLLHGGLPDAVERRLDDWRDKKMAAVPPDSVTRVEIARGARSYRLVRDQGWRFADGTPADSAAVVRLLENFRALSATGFPSPAQADSARFTRPRRQLRLFGPSGPRLTLLFDSTASGFLVRADTARAVYLFSSWAADQLTPPDSLLRKRPAAATVRPAPPAPR
jgi:hypothetical protein